MKYCFAYIRTSRSSKPDLTLEHQKDMLGRFYSNTEGYDWAGYYIDHEQGREPLGMRTSGRALQKRVGNGDMVICVTVDRISTSFRDSVRIIKWFCKAGVRLVFVKDWCDLSNHRMVYDLFSAMEEGESRNHSERASKKKVDGPPQFGFKRVGAILDIQPDEMRYMATCYQLLKSRTPEECMAVLRDRGIVHPRTKQYAATPQTITSMSNRFNQYVKTRKDLESGQTNRGELPVHIIKAAYSLEVDQVVE